MASARQQHRSRIAKAMRVSVFITHFDNCDESTPYSEEVQSLGYARILGRVVSMHHARGKARVLFDLDSKCDEVPLEDNLKQTLSHYNSGQQ